MKSHCPFHRQAFRLAQRVDSIPDDTVPAGMTWRRDRGGPVAGAHADIFRSTSFEMAMAPPQQAGAFGADGTFNAIVVG
jgi:hypothetical protein